MSSTGSGPRGESAPSARFLRWWRSQVLVAPAPTPEDVDRVVDLLSALEYGKKKEETELIGPVFAQFGISRRPTKIEIAPAIAAKPGFEPFFLAVLDEVRPFAAMLTEVYEFLGRHGTVGRRASVFSVSTAGAEAVLDFSLASFPRQLLRLLVAGEVEDSTIELALPDYAGAPVDSADDFSLARLSEVWRALDGNWDNNEFYDLHDRSTGFFRIVSFASLWRGRMEAEVWRSVAAVVEPVMDRLAALLDAFEKSGVNMPFDGPPVALRGVNRPLEIQAHRATSHTVGLLPTPTQLDAHLAERPFVDRPTTLGDWFARLAHDWAIIVHLWRTPELVRGDDDSSRQLPRDAVAEPAAFADTLTRAASAFRERLDAAAPVVASGRRQVDLEQLIEFTELPFWKHRWFLYELWTLVRVLRVGATVGDVRLEGLIETRPGVTEWVLPGGMARSPVARIVKHSRSASVWTQLKSQHPATGAGLEPDLRIRTDGPSESDIFLIENKDRLGLGGGEMAEIVRRYVTGTDARGAWFINYEEFPSSASNLEGAYPGRGVRVVSHFRPFRIPTDFEVALAGILREHLDRPAPRGSFEVALTWTAPPKDLDLHAWIERDGERHHLSFQTRGAIDAKPFAALDADRRSGGTETITVTNTRFDLLTIAVHNYSGDGTIADGRPVVTLRGDGEALGEHGAPDSPGEWWTALEIDSSGDHRWVDTISPAPPFE